MKKEEKIVGQLSKKLRAEILHLGCRKFFKYLVNNELEEFVKERHLKKKKIRTLNFSDKLWKDNDVAITFEM